MLTPPNPDTARRLREYLAEVGYREAGIVEALGNLDPPLPALRNLPRLLARSAEPTPLNLLLRWFYGVVAVPRREAATVLPADILDALVDTGMLRAEGEALHPTLLLVPMNDFWVASDTYQHLAGEDAYHHVLTVNPTARQLYRFSLRETVDTALDLGAGGGIQALGLAAHAERVSATDLNPRASQYAAFNAALNGFDNIECLTGDCYAPVAGRRFQHIVCNPPFVLTPDRRFLYRDNDLELDGLVQRVIREGADHLEEGGIMQVILEWVAHAGEDWHERVSDWCRGLGCDAWLFKAYTQAPDWYALSRLRETPLADPGGDADSYQSWMDYYHRHGIENIHGGLLLLRRRHGDNWLELEELDDTPEGNFGDLVRRRLDARDFLMESADWQARLLTTPLQLAPEARLIQECVREGAGWRTLAIKLQSVRPMAQPVALDGAVAQFLGSLDGEAPLATRLAEFCARLGVAEAQVRDDCLQNMRHLLLRGLAVTGKG